jgi:opacity protein-like surface antigen
LVQLTVAAALVAAIGASAPASAQVYVGARGSVFLPNDRSAGLQDFDTGWGVEGFAGYQFRPNFALEGGVGYYRTKWSDSEDVISEKDTVSAIPLTITALGVLPLAEQGRLYAGAGVGAYFAKAKVEGSWREEGQEIAASDDSTDTALGFHVVAGAEYLVTPALGMDLQAKWFRTKPEFSFFGVSSDKVDIGGFLLSFGLRFHL